MSIAEREPWRQSSVASLDGEGCRHRNPGHERPLRRYVNIILGHSLRQPLDFDFSTALGRKRLAKTTGVC